MKSLAGLLVIACLLGAPVSGQAAEWEAEPSLYESLEKRLKKQEEELRALRKQLESRQDGNNGEDDSSSGTHQEPGDEPTCGVSQEIRRLPLVVEDSSEPSCAAEEPAEFHTLRFYADYDQGFVIRPFDEEEHPFELQVNGALQFRHVAFARDVDSWTDNAGITRPVRPRNHFEMERARLMFSGFALDKRLTYFVQLDGDNDDGEVVEFFDYWWGWEASDDLLIQLGKRKVPAVRNWQLSGRDTRLIDRPMATDFFRPDRTTGIAAEGNFGESGQYEMMVGNGYRTAKLSPDETDTRFIFAMTNWWEPWGDFGSLPVDYECSPTPRIQFGHSMIYAPSSGEVAGVPVGEADFVRLTDGTRLTQTGALAPGVTVNHFDVYFYSVDAAWKWNGWSASSEVFLRWIEGIRGDGIVPHDSLFQRGFYVEGGRFLIPKKLDVNVQYSWVDGLFGDASSFAAGLNWFPLDTTNLKISFDVTTVDGSPLNNSSSNILVGDDGTLFRTQFQAEF